MMKRELSTRAIIGIFVAVLAIIVIIGFFETRPPTENQNATLGVMRESVVYRETASGKERVQKGPRALMPPGR
ncbi:MAG TPA: hypothetical protein VFJ58_08675 [Armatimonadota bacterium]|nr:hypothetical protein [Armatimonadota bacterium]